MRAPPRVAVHAGSVPMTVRVRSLFLSDIHLGNPGCQAGLLVEFLKTYTPEQLFLIGDIVDLEYLERNFYWHATHGEALRRLIGATRRGTAVTYIPGNHDERLRAFCGRRLGGIRVERMVVHESAAGERFLLLHGDEFDGLLGCGGRLARLGAFAYRSAIRLNTRVNRLGDRLGLGYAPLASFLKHRFGSARDYMDRFRDTVALTAEGCGVTGVICGHIHRPEDRQVGGIRYLNTGDWVENCTGVVEHGDGRFELVRWAGVGRQRPVLVAAEPSRVAA
jgi:UDP-2,3-diacylglucosamine pyrophosphatase LpxH